MRAYLSRPYMLCRPICYRITEVNPLHHQFRFFIPCLSSTAVTLHVIYMSFKQQTTNDEHEPLKIAEPYFKVYLQISQKYYI